MTHTTFMADTLTRRNKSLRKKPHIGYSPFYPKPCWFVAFIPKETIGIVRVRHYVDERYAKIAAKLIYKHHYINKGSN